MIRQLKEEGFDWVGRRVGVRIVTPKTSYSKTAWMPTSHVYRADGLTKLPQIG